MQENSLKPEVQDILVDAAGSESYREEGTEILVAECNVVSKHDHHNSAIYATSHVHSAVGHVKPHHSTRIDL